MSAFISVLQRQRLLRETWPSVTAFAQELYTILGQQGPATSDAPLNITNPKDQVSALTLHQTANNAGLAIQDPNNNILTVGLSGGQVTFRNQLGQQVPVESQPKAPSTQTYLGQVKTTAAGSNFTVTTFRQGTSQAGEDLPVTQFPAVPNGFTITAGTWCIVVQQVDGTWVMHVPKSEWTATSKPPPPAPQPAPPPDQPPPAQPTPPPPQPQLSGTPSSGGTTR